MSGSKRVGYVIAVTTPLFLVRIPRLPHCHPTPPAQNRLALLRTAPVASSLPRLSARLSL